MSLLGCFSIFFPTSARTRAAILDAEDDEEYLIDSFSSSELSTLSSRGGTATSASSYRGIGSLSGKAIMAVGNLVIKGIEVVDIQVRLRKIATQLSHEDARVSHASLVDLIELQRNGLYSEKVRRRAMQLVVLVMCRRNAFQQLVHVLVQQPLEEIRLFLEQLSRLKFSSEKLVPRLIAQISEEDSRTYQDKTQSGLTDRFCHMVLTVIKRHPSILLDETDPFPLRAVIVHLVRTERHYDIMLSDWDDTEMQRFIRYMNRLRQSEWTSNITLQDYPFLFSILGHGTKDPADHAVASDAFCEIISDILQSRPALLCQTLPVDEIMEIVNILFERRHFRSVVATLLASESADVRQYLFRMANTNGPMRQPGFLIDTFDEQEIVTRAERQTNFADLLRRLEDWHPHFLREVFSLEQFTALIITAVGDPDLPPNWSYTHLLLYHFAMRGSLSPLRACFIHFVDTARR